jgi:hypothetical protein
MWPRAAKCNLMGHMRSAARCLWAHDLKESCSDLIFWKECLFSETDFAFLGLDEIMCHVVDAEILNTSALYGQSCT